MTYALKIQEERKEGFKEGQIAYETNKIISMLNRNKTPDFIADALEISLDKVKSVAKANGIALHS